jgi:hypothetical protein
LALLAAILGKSTPHAAFFAANWLVNRVMFAVTAATAADEKGMAAFAAASYAFAAIN